MAVPNFDKESIYDAYDVFWCLIGLFGYRRKTGEQQVADDGSQSAGVKPGIYQRRWNGYNNKIAKPKNQRKMFYIREKYYRPTNPQTSKQQAQRAKMARANEAWRSLAESERQIWRDRAKKLNRRGQPLFISEYLNSEKDRNGKFPYDLPGEMGI